MNGTALRWLRSLGAASLLLAGGIATQTAQATPIGIGYMSFDQLTGTTAAFDITNLTGPNSALDPIDFPVSTPVTLSNLNLVVNFSDGTNLTFTQPDFALSLDGLSYDGPTVAVGGAVQPVSATLNGILSPTSLNIGSMVTVNASFSPATITDVTGGPLFDGDFAEIFATTAVVTPPSGVPEPPTPLLMLAALAGIGFARRGAKRRCGKVTLSGAPASRAALYLLACGVALAPLSSKAADVQLATATTPSTGVAGVTSVNLTTRGLPFGTTAAEVNVAIAPTCAVGGPVSGEVDTTASSIRSLFGPLKRVQFLIPGTLAQGTYYVSLSGSAGGTAFASTTCSIVSVTASNATLNACLPTSSLAVAVGPTVTAYVPNGWWGGSSTGVQAVPIEGGGSPVSIPTANVVNSCSSNPATGETVCTANSTDVYLISGSSLVNTLTSGSNNFASFSGGSCQNCGVAINALTNTAYIEVGMTPSPSNSGVQPLNLGTNAFSTPFPVTHVVSENISVDPGRNLLLTPGESNSYDLLQLNTFGGITGEFLNPTIGGGGEYDSAAEDCTTGIALAANEFSSNVSLADLNQATFTAGTPGTWTAPSTVYSLAGSFSAGTSGISVAPGGSHLGIVTGEFGGQSFAVFQLPSTPATGGTAPTILDYVYVPSLPNTPDGSSFSAGYDPHTITAYTSPNDGKPYGVIADWATGTPSYLAVIDLQKLMAAPRVAGTHTLDPSYNMLSNGALRYVATH